MPDGKEPTHFEKMAGVLAAIGIFFFILIYALIWLEGQIGFPTIVEWIFFIVYAYYFYKIFIENKTPKHKDWPYLMIILFVIEAVLLTIGFIAGLMIGLNGGTLADNTNIPYIEYPDSTLTPTISPPIYDKIIVVNNTMTLNFSFYDAPLDGEVYLDNVSLGNTNSGILAISKNLLTAPTSNPQELCIYFYITTDELYNACWDISEEDRQYDILSLPAF